MDGNKSEGITVLEIPIDENLEDIEISEEILEKLPERKQKEYKEYLKLKKGRAFEIRSRISGA